MTFAFISGLNAPDDAFDWLINELVQAVPGSECSKYKEDDDLSGVEAYCGVCHSFGAYEGLCRFNDGYFGYLMGLDYVSKNFWSRLGLVWPTANRPGVICLHRWSQPIIYPRSTGIKNAKDVLIDCGHNDFLKRDETRDYLINFARGNQWDLPQGA